MAPVKPPRNRIPFLYKYTQCLKILEKCLISTFIMVLFSEFQSNNLVKLSELEKNLRLFKLKNETFWGFLNSVDMNSTA